MKEDHITDEQYQTIIDALTAFEAACAPLYSVLTREQKQKYGSISEQNKLIVNKANDLKRDFPAQVSPDVNWVEFDADYKSRSQIEEILLRAQQATDQMKASKILYDYDNYQAALKDYKYAKYKNDCGDKGYSVKVEQYKQFFSSSKETSE